MEALVWRCYQLGQASVPHLAPPGHPLLTAIYWFIESGIISYKNLVSLHNGSYEMGNFTHHLTLLALSFSASVSHFNCLCYFFVLFFSSFLGFSIDDNNYFCSPAAVSHFQWTTFLSVSRFCSTVGTIIKMLDRATTWSSCQGETPMTSWRGEILVTRRQGQNLMTSWQGEILMRSW